MMAQLEEELIDSSAAVQNEAREEEEELQRAIESLRAFK